MTYLTDKVQQEQIGRPDPKGPEGRERIVCTTRDVTIEEARDLLRAYACAARSDEAQEILCGELGLPPLPRVSPTYQPLDSAIVGGIIDGRVAVWTLYTFA